ncbi:hypothetical protein ACJMK2_041532 [Sinanodonta woodiana]|uniref:BTB domain-containing protein n=1 Tax=Sinanodonta woodiana TaxID=1069815 RepID=A0ABD3W7T4_SINWO
MSDIQQEGKIVDKNRLMLHGASYSEGLLKRLNGLRGQGMFTDIILCVGQEEFPCHRNVLAASSLYFQAMFTCDLRERNDLRVVYDKVSPWTLKRIIDYVYTGVLEVTPENAQEMLAAGNLFQYPAIVEGCCEFLLGQLHPSNCLGIEYFAQVHSCKQLQEDANKYVLENFSTVVKFDEFLELSVDRLLSYIGNDLIDVKNEETVYEAVMRWVRYDKEERKEHLCQLLQEVRLAVIDLTYLEKIREDRFIQTCSCCLELVAEAQEKHTTIHDQFGRRRKSMQDSVFHPRPSTVAKEVMVVVGGINSYVTRSVEMFDLQKNRWTQLPELPKSITWYSVCAVVNSILVVGGILDGRIIDSAWRFDTSRQTWTEIPSMNKPRAKHASAVIDDKLYVFGGVTCTPSFVIADNDTIECYDPTKKKWFVVGQSAFPRKLSKVVPFNNTFVEVGGLQGDVKVNTMDCYICSNQGMVVHPVHEQFILPEAIEFAQIVVHNGIFYIIWENTKKFISLDPEKRKFQKLADLNYCHIQSGVTVIGEKIYITGGLENIGSRSSNIVECFNPETNTWTVEKSMLEARGFHGCVTVQM